MIHTLSQLLFIQSQDTRAEALCGLSETVAPCIKQIPRCLQRSFLVPLQYRHRLYDTVRGVLSTLALALSSLVINPVAHADNFKIYHADTEVVDKVYRLNANLDYNFSEEALKAIDNGVPLVLVLEIELYQPRDYIWDKKIAELEQRYKLQYHALAEQYLVTNLNSASQQTYASFHSAIASIRNINGLPVIDENLLEKGIAYSARMRASVELSALPGPLRLNAIFSRKWRMDSDWYEWTVLKN